MKFVLKPMETFFEENLQFYLMEINKNPLLKGVLKAIVEGKLQLPKLTAPIK